MLACVLISMCQYTSGKQQNSSAPQPRFASYAYALQYIFSHKLYDNVEMVLNEDLYYLAAEHMDCNVYNAMCSVCNSTYREVTRGVYV